MPIAARHLAIVCLAIPLAGGAAIFWHRQTRMAHHDVGIASEPPTVQTDAVIRTPPPVKQLLPPLAGRAQDIPPPRPLLTRVRRTKVAAGPPTGVFSTQPEAVAATTVPIAVLEELAAEDGAVDEPMVPLPLARAALALVGADPDAEMVWEAAINDPSMSPHDRSDLIEDLNEVGIDPRNLTPDDLPLIVSRLAMIEQLAPDAMDQTNLDAFAEAYKDLVNMYVRVTGQ